MENQLPVPNAVLVTDSLKYTVKGTMGIPVRASVWSTMTVYLVWLNKIPKSDAVKIKFSMVDTYQIYLLMHSLVLMLMHSFVEVFRK